MKSKNNNSRRRGGAAPRAAAISRTKIWTFRLALATVPLAILIVLEITLRMAGFGYPTAFLLPSQSPTEKLFIQNNHFGWRFFGRRMARVPAPISIAREKPPGTVRIFVYGESAAFGDPQPRYGLPRMLQAMLESRHPGVRFEVINTAMTGINSHTILPIARDCAGAGGDIWVVYMGNNEVVGPFGAGTIFGPRSLPLPLIRASLALKSTRTGELIDTFVQALLPPPPSKREWGGMMMFLDSRLRGGDPLMEGVYSHFASNLTDIIQAGRAHGVGVVVSTLGVNMRDCAPFASLHRTDLSAAQLADWQTNFDRGATAQLAGRYAEAQKYFLLAAAIDDSFADLRFRQGQCALASGDATVAERNFEAARDLDALRFRCDSRLNQIIRSVAGGREKERIRLAEGEGALADASPNGLPGSEFFYEHVHLTFAGNYVLARTIAGQVEDLLPSGISPADGPWPEISVCADRLGFTDRAMQEALSEIIGRRMDPPFTWQSDHAAEMQRLARLSESLPPADSGGALQAALKVTDVSLRSHPNDGWLLEQAAELQEAAGNFAAAATAAQKAVEICSSSSEAWSTLGRVQAKQKDYGGAATAFQHVLALDSQDVWAMQNDAMCLRKQNQPDAAVREFKRALAIQPRFGMGWLGLGQTYEEMGRTNDALRCYRLAVANPIHRADELTTLARFCQSRNWLEAAATNYAEAIQLNPADAGLRIETGRVMAALKRHVEAAQCFTVAADLQPDSGTAHFLCGLEWGELDRPAEAEKEFEEAVRIWPDLVQARVNLGIALYQQRKYAEASDSFQAALQKDPANSTALKYLQFMPKDRRGKAIATPNQ